MNYTSALEYIHSLERFGSVPGLERVSELLKRLGDPQNELRFVHIAGTNGKGSTATMTASVLHTAGYKTGLYISPYVLEFRERMQINGQMIACEELAALVEEVKAIADQMGQEGQQPTEFEVVTATALLWYKRQECDIVVLEVGLGGRFDATNIIRTPLVSAITAIDLDHTQVLGDTVAQIAFEKCGIIKKGGTTVTYPDQQEDALAVIMQRCAEEANPLVMGNLNAVKVNTCTLEGSRIIYRDLELYIPLLGKHQIANCVTVVEILFVLRQKGFGIADQHILEGIAKVRFPARMEILSRNPLIILDGAHNLSGARALNDALALVEGMRINAITGMLADKDYNSTLKLLGPKLSKLIAVTPKNPRALPAQELAKAAKALSIDALPCGSLEEALEVASADQPDLLLIFGSLYLASEIRNKIIR